MNFDYEESTKHALAVKRLNDIDTSDMNEKEIVELFMNILKKIKIEYAQQAFSQM